MRRTLAPSVVLILAAMAAHSPVAAQLARQASVSECKGLNEGACAGNQRCSWVKAFKTKKGRDVAAFCRKRPERREAAQAKPAVAQAQSGVQ